MHQADQSEPERIDLERLRQDYFADDAFLVDILNTFVSEVIRVSDDVAAAQTSPDGTSIRTLAHRLKGSMRAVGLFSSAEKMDRVECALISLDCGERERDRILKEIKDVAKIGRNAAHEALGRLSLPE